MIAIFFICSCTFQPKEFVIGAILHLTGNQAVLGLAAKQGMQMAIDKINEKGGCKINGRKMVVKIIYEDDEGISELAEQKADKLINTYGAKGILGGLMSRVSLAIAPICQENGIPMITPISTNTKVTEIGDYIFRACFIDPFQGAVMANYVFNNRKITKAAIIFDKENEYNKGLSEVFKYTFEEYGGTITAFIPFSDEENTEDYKDMLKEVKTSGAQFLFAPNFYAAAALMMKQAVEIGLHIPIGGGDGWDSPLLMEIGGQSVEGQVFSTHFSKDDPNPQVQAFVKEYRERYNSDPDAFATLSYDAANILLNAVEKSGSLDGKILKNTIKNTKYQAITGMISYDEKRNPTKSAVIIKIEDGKQVYVTTINPL